MPLIRALFITLTIIVPLALASSAPPLVHAAATPESNTPEEAVVGRLGGDRASFTDALGSPLSEDSVNGSRYDVDEYGLVLVSFGQTSKTLMADDVAAVIVLRAPRSESVPATSPDPADWSLAAARRAAESFLPRDVDLGDPAETPEPDRLALPCTSAALAELAPPARASANPGECTVTFLTPDGETVSFVTLALGDASAEGAAPDPCEGMSAWATTTAARLTEANAALDVVASLAEDDPTAVATLETITEEFTALAKDQAASPVPAAAIAANTQLVAAFTAYEAAIDLAATGLATDDQPVLADAATAVEAARTSYADADARILAAIEGCAPKT